jgi:nucleotide-binding universal stress UspA family protein
MQEASGAQHAAEEAFRQAAAAGGCKDLEWRAPSGPPIDAAVAHGRCADLILVGQPDSALADSSFSARLVSSVLLETGRPMLVIPSIAAPESVGKRILVAWDGGREATRALADAIPFLERAERVTVVSVDPGASMRGADVPARERLAAYLRTHGVAARFEHHDLGKADIEVGDWLLSRAADWSIDLLVMGGYGHPRWRERVLGGATRVLLATMTLSVLMSH